MRARTRGWWLSVLVVAALLAAATADQWYRQNGGAGLFGSRERSGLLPSSSSREAPQPAGLLPVPGGAPPDSGTRLLEQIETARLGLLAAQSRPAPVPRPAGAVPLGMLAVGAALMGCAAGAAGMLLWTRNCARSAPAAAAVAERDQPARGEGPGNGLAPPLFLGTEEGPAAVEAPRSAALARMVAALGGEREADRHPGNLEERLSTLEGSLLHVLQAVEAVASRVVEAAPDLAPSRPVAGGGLRAEGRVLREPWDLGVDSTPGTTSVPAEPAGGDGSAGLPSTFDGRDLVRVRRAVLRLAEEGWDRGRIADRLRLPAADVSLILRSSDPSPDPARAFRTPASFHPVRGQDGIADPAARGR